MHPQLLNHLKSYQYQYYRGTLGSEENNQNARWTDHIINDRIVFSHRKVDYTFDTFEDKMHSHEFCEFVFYVSGDIHFVVDNKIYRPQYGDVFIVRPSEIHSAKLEKPSCYDRYVMWFDTNIFDHFKDGRDELGGFIFNRNKGEDNLITLPENILKLVISLLKKVELTVSEPFNGSDIIAYSNLLQLFVLINNHRLKKLDINRSVSVPESLLKAINYIDMNFKDIKNISEIAENMHMSREHISRLFKKYYGTTINNYVNEKRIAESKKLLMAGYNVTEACYKSGFNNLSYFIKCFKKKFDVTPLEYKRMMQRNDANSNIRKA